MPFPWSVKETPACPTADISLTLSSAGDVQGYFWRSSGTFHCSSSWNDPERPQTAVVLAVLLQHDMVTFSSLPVVLVLRLADAFDPEWECYCNRLTSPPCKSSLHLPETTKLYLRLNHYGRVIYLPWHAIKWLVAVLGKDAIKSADEW